MPGRKKQTNRVLLLTAVLLSLFSGVTLTQSSVNPNSITRRQSIPDIIVADGTARETFSGEAADTQADLPDTADDATISVTQTPVKKGPSDQTPSAGKWILDGGKWYYQIKDYYKTGWLYDDNKWYYFDQTGEMQIGWVRSQKRWFFMNEDGIMQTGWVGVNGTWYHMDDEGIMQTGWLEQDGQWFYLGEDGEMQTGWLEQDGKWFYLNANGTMATGWIVDNGKRYFLKDDGVWDPAAIPDAASIPDAPKGAMVALTYDDGPGMYTDRLLNALEASGAKATFFMVGSNIPDYPSTIQRMEALGCELGSHTTDHKDLTQLSAEEIPARIDGVNQALTEIVGHGATLVRPPYGAVNETVSASVPAPLILWSIDTRDWETLDIPATVDAVFSSVCDGSIILMHDIHETSVAASEIIIPTLIEKGYQLVTVSELAAAKGITLENGSTYHAMTE